LFIGLRRLAPRPLRLGGSSLTLLLAPWASEAILSASGRLQLDIGQIAAYWGH